MAGTSQEATSRALQVTAGKRSKLPVPDAVTVWLTGLPGSGKSTLAFALKKCLRGNGRACFVLDGDDIRRGLNRDLGFSPADRKENIRRIAEVARLLNDAGMVAIAAFISPYREIREMARQIIRPKHFIEIHVATRLEVCEERDPKGLYVKARAGLIADFTGVSAPYETPRSPDLTVDAGRLSVGESLTMIMFALERRLKRVARKL